MATTKLTSLSIADIEKQIAKIGAEIEKARAQELKVAEKTLATAEKSAAAAKALLTNLKAKGTTSTAAKSRAAALKEAYADHLDAVTIAKQTVKILTDRNKTAEKLAKKVNKALVNTTKPKKVAKQTAEQKAVEPTPKASKKMVKPKKAESSSAEQSTATEKTKTDHADLDLPMTAKPKAPAEEATSPSNDDFNTEESNNVELPSEGETLSTNIERPANSSSI